ncbi:MAG: FAD-dependent oxidoreductase [Promethearchaeota archaeon]|nr:MAG: FAD-dependent oxidoreductase [Candidatus Lokiarchaeota archaeon]
MSGNNIDVAVIGGGVAGLAAAISFQRHGLTVLLLERDSEFGGRIKGEVINKSADIFKKLFHQATFPSKFTQIVYKSAKYYTPSTKKHALRVFPQGKKIGIEYRELIHELVSIAIAEGVRLKLNSEVLQFIQRDARIVGLRYKEFDHIYEEFPRIIISAVGFHTSLERPPPLKSPKNVCPTVKIIAQDLNIPDPHILEFFLLEIPGVIWIFPKPHNRAEIGVTLWQDHDRYDLRAILDHAAHDHPFLKARLSRGAQIYHKSELVVFGGPSRVNFAPNLFIIGDAMGHVGAVGGSGIISSMTVGYDLGEFLGTRLKTVGELQMNDFVAAQDLINKSAIGKWLKKEQSSAKAMREILYKPLKSPDEIDVLWDKFKGFIESR